MLILKMPQISIVLSILTIKKGKGGVALLYHVSNPLTTHNLSPVGSTAKRMEGRTDEGRKEGLIKGWREERT